MRTSLSRCATAALILAGLTGCQTGSGYSFWKGSSTTAPPATTTAYDGNRFHAGNAGRPDDCGTARGNRLCRGHDALLRGPRQHQPDLSEHRADRLRRHSRLLVSVHRGARVSGRSVRRLREHAESLRHDANVRRARQLWRQPLQCRRHTTRPTRPLLPRALRMRRNRAVTALAAPPTWLRAPRTPQARRRPTPQPRRRIAQTPAYGTQTPAYGTQTPSYSAQTPSYSTSTVPRPSATPYASSGNGRPAYGNSAGGTSVPSANSYGGAPANGSYGTGSAPGAYANPAQSSAPTSGSSFDRYGASGAGSITGRDLRAALRRDLDAAGKRFAVSEQFAGRQCGS